MRTRRSSPDSRLGSTVELAGGKVGGCLNLMVVREALAGKGIPPEDSPPSFNEIEPAGAGWHRLLMDAGMLMQPLPDRSTGMTREIVVDQIQVAFRIRSVDRIEQLEEASRVAGRSGEGQCLAI